MSNNKGGFTRYCCAQCGRIPTSESEIFQGCECGHRLFRIIPPPKRVLASVEPPNHTGSKEVPDFLTIQEKSQGIYSINIDQLLQNAAGKPTPLVVGTEGVFVIKGLTPKRRG